MTLLKHTRSLATTFAAAIALCCLATGCGGEKTYRVSGRVTFKGQPIPAGKIYFVPDGAKGNKGATGFADIKDGNYDTAAPGGSGSIGGPMLIRIEGRETAELSQTDKSGEPTAKPLFPPYQVAAELPKAEGTKDVDVPADAVKGQQKKSNDP